MDFGALIRTTNHARRDSRLHPGAVSPIDLKLGIFHTREDLYGENEYEYYVNLIHLFDRAIVDGNLFALSIEQQELLEEYFEKALPITRQHTSAWRQDYIEDELTQEEYDERYRNLPRHIQRLDIFLGEYFGDDNGRYSHYGKKQFHRKRQPFSPQAQPITRTQFQV